MGAYISVPSEAAACSASTAPGYARIGASAMTAAFLTLACGSDTAATRGPTATPGLAAASA